MSSAVVELRPTAEGSRGGPAWALFGRTLDGERRALLGWGAGLVGLSVTMLLLYPAVRDNSAMEEVLASYPEAFQELFGLAGYTTGAGYLRAEMFSLTVPLLIVIMAVLWASDAVAGEEDRKTIDLLLANPVSRRQVVVQKWLAVAAAVGAVCLAVLVTLAAGAPLVSLHVGFVPLLAAVVATTLLGLVYASLALALAAATGRRGLARGATTLLAVIAYLVSSLADLVDWLRPWRVLSPWHHALGVDPLSSGFEPVHVAVLVALVASLVSLAVVGFERRDLAV